MRAKGMKTARILRILVVGAALAGASACHTDLITVPPGSEAYRVGFRDGCDSGYADAGNGAFTYVDAGQSVLPADDYRDGWNTGFYDCKRSFQRIQRTVHLFLG